MPYPYLGLCSMHISRKFNADFTQSSMQNAMRKRNLSGFEAESKRNPSGILAESMYAVSMLDSLQHEDFTQISRRFHADFTQNGLRNRSGIGAES